MGVRAGHADECRYRRSEEKGKGGPFFWLPGLFDKRPELGILGTEQEKNVDRGEFGFSFFSQGRVVFGKIIFKWVL